MLFSGIYVTSSYSQIITQCHEHSAESDKQTYTFSIHVQAMLRINEHMHKIWKKQMEEKPLQSGIAGWIMNLPFDTKAKEWLAAEERYKQEVQLKNILPAVADKFFLDREGDEKGASILCFDEIQVKKNY
jgi:hypothetical protein